MNIIAISGRLTYDPDVRYTASQMCVARFTVAIDRYSKGEKYTDFIPCVAFGKNGEFVEKFFEKGKGIEVVGTLQQNNYDKDGTTIKSFQVVADRVGFVSESKQGSGYQKSNRQDDLSDDGFRELTGDEVVPF